MSTQKKEDPLSSKTIKVITIIAIVFSSLFFTSKLNAYEGKLRVDKIEIENKAQTVRQLEAKFDKVNTNLTKSLEDKDSSAQKQAELEQEKLRLEQELEKTRQQLQAKNNAKNQTYAAAQVTPDKASLMRGAGIPESDWAYVDYIVTKESGWSSTVKNRTSSAYGLCQTMLSMHTVVADFKTNPAAQMQWCNEYAHGKYGSWARAYAYWLAHHNW